MDASRYSVLETLRDGRKVEIRALEPEDRAGLLAAVAGMSDEARYRRFFAPKRAFSEKEPDLLPQRRFCAARRARRRARQDRRVMPVIRSGRLLQSALLASATRRRESD